MGKFILGVIITLLVLILGVLGFAMLGFFPTQANVAPPSWERRLANTAVDASMERHAPHVTNPVPPNDQNLEDGMKLLPRQEETPDVTKLGQYYHGRKGH